MAGFEGSRRGSAATDRQFLATNGAGCPWTNRSVPNNVCASSAALAAAVRENADRSVDARLYRLRRRFGPDKEAGWKIKTVRPHGYMFSVEPW